MYCASDCSREFAPPIPSRIQKLPAGTQRFVNFHQARPHLLRLKLQQALAHFRSVALGFQRDDLLCQLRVLGFALLLLRERGVELRAQRLLAFGHLVDQVLDPLQHSRCCPVPFFQRSHPRQVLRRVLCRQIFLLTQRDQSRLTCRRLLLQLRSTRFQFRNPVLPRCLYTGALRFDSR